MYRGYWRRAFANLIDVVLLIGLFAIVAFIKDTFCNSTGEIDSFSVIASLRYLPLEVLLQDYYYTLLCYLGAYVVIWLLYECFFLYSPFSGTPGKHIFGLAISFHKKSVYYILLRTIIKICLFISILGIMLQFLFIYLDKKGRSVHDFAAGSQLVTVQAVKGQGVPKGLWFFVLLALVSLIPYYFVHRQGQENYTEIVYSEVIGMDSSGRELYEGIWSKGKKWTLTFTYLNNKLYIYDSTYYFKDFNYRSDHTLVCTDRDGNSFLLERNGDRLIATETEDANGRHYEFLPKVETAI
jgi:uncharacterized RDD family membrane protein YckC